MDQQTTDLRQHLVAAADIADRLEYYVVAATLQHALDILDRMSGGRGAPRDHRSAPRPDVSDS
ncbi:hypothetical protein FHT00_001145 [Sphingomonas insulae]|uniref:Uncharacterized protein n=1 Tax=Sphingomonas insulae TaxID=424800 RepID=A0ABN1HRA8_9SPHN|nr:hypothetical protein [Sphingomonas insulae]NIJ29212.1 hypothetical protein [Sphingomonas insulae]